MSTGSVEKAQVAKFADGLHDAVKEMIAALPPSSTRMQATEILQRVASLQEYVAPEQVEYRADPEDPEAGVPATGWMTLGGLTVCLTYAMADGKLLVALENSTSNGDELPVRVQHIERIDPLWEGEV